MQLIDTLYWSDQRWYYIQIRLPSDVLLYSSISILKDFVDWETLRRMVKKSDIFNLKCIWYSSINFAFYRGPIETELKTLLVLNYLQLGFFNFAWFWCYSSDILLIWSCWLRHTLFTDLLQYLPFINIILVFFFTRKHYIIWVLISIVFLNQYILINFDLFNEFLHHLLWYCHWTHSFVL